MSKLILVSVVCAKSAASFLVVVSGDKVMPLKSWGKASYPVPASVVLDKDTDVVKVLRECGLDAYTFKSSLDYPNNCFSDETESVKLHKLVTGKLAPQAPQAPFSSVEEVNPDSLPSQHQDILNRVENKVISWKQARQEAISLGLPQACNSPNAVAKWLRENAPAAPQAAPQAPTAPQAAPQAPTAPQAAPQALDQDMMKDFLAFQAFMRSQGK